MNGEMEKRYGREGVRFYRKKEEELNIGNFLSKVWYFLFVFLLIRV